MPALGYKKSRTGCLRCKQRRVKCDENRPCRACVRHGVACTLVTPLPQPAQSSPGASTQSGEQLPQKDAVVTTQPSRRTRRGTSRRTSASAPPPEVEPPQPSSQRGRLLAPDSYPYFARFTTHQSGEPPEPNTGSWMVDLELMHHWSTHTYLTLPRANDANNVWQFEVPKMAFKHPFLMNQLLAVSAFHLAYLNPGQCHAYSLRASQHQDHAVHLLRIALPELSGKSCDALFAASLLLLFGGFCGVLNQSNRSNPSADDILDIFVLTRGVNGVLKTAEDTIAKGPLREFFALPKHPAPTMPASLQALLDKITGLGPRLKTRGLDDHIQTLVEGEITSLISCIHTANATTAMPEVRIAATWPIYLSTDFINLLRQRHPAAMTLLMYFCVVLCTAESTFWYMKGWGLAVARSIANNIEPSWNDIIEWPMGYIAAQDTANQTETASRRFGLFKT